jgi:hypothetical protein
MLQNKVSCPCFAQNRQKVHYNDNCPSLFRQFIWIRLCETGLEKLLFTKKVLIEGLGEAYAGNCGKS